MRRRGLLAVVALAVLGCSSRPLGEVEVPASAVRRVLVPSRFRAVSSRGATEGALPSAVALGGAAAGREVLLLEFEELKESQRLLRGLLRLETTGVPGRVVELSVARSEPATAEPRDWSNQPRASYASVSVRLSTDLSPLRVDVTELLKAERAPGEPLRLLIWVEPQGAEPVLIQTGAAGGAGPRLETYWE